MMGGVAPLLVAPPARLLVVGGGAALGSVRRIQQSLVDSSAVSLAHLLRLGPC